MPFEVPPSAWMPDKEAIRHIKNVDRCTAANAIKQLKNVIACGAVSFRLPHGARRQILSEIIPRELQFFEFTGPGRSTPIVTPSLLMPKLDWTTAHIHASGTVAFGSSSRFRFWVRRVDVLRIWPGVAEDADHRVTRPDTKIRKGPKPGALRRYDTSDRSLFPKLKQLMALGKSCTAAAVSLAERGNVKGFGTPESRAKRLAALYKREQS